MAISHAFSNTVADATGTITVWNGATTASVAATDVVRPSNWNSAHNVGYTISGNTTNASTASGTDVVLSAGPGIVMGGSTGTLVVQGKHVSDYEPVPLGNNTSYLSFGQNSLYFFGFKPVANVSMTAIENTVSLSSATSSISHGVSQTISYGVYSRDGTGASSTRFTRMDTSSFSIAAGYSSNLSGSLSIGNANTSYTTSSAGTVFGSVLSNQKILSMPFATSFEQGQDYLWCMALSTNSVGGTGALRLSHLVLTNMTNTSFGRMGNSTLDVAVSSVRNMAALAVYSTSSNAWPATIADSQFSQATVHQLYMSMEA